MPKWIAEQRVLAFVGGAVAFQFLAELPSARFVGLTAILLLSLVYFRKFFGAALVLGWAWAWAVAVVQLSDRLTPACDGRDYEITGAVESLPQRSGASTRFNFRVDAMPEPAECSLPRRVRLSWRDAPELAAGQQWRLPVRLRTPHGSLNPGGFDYEQWLYARGLGATGYVKGTAAALPAHWGASLRPMVWQQVLNERIDAMVGDRPFAGVVKALAIGASQDISTKQWEVFRRTGTLHLVVVSGSHIALIAGLAFVGLRWSAAALHLRRIPPYRIAAVGGFLAATAYSAVAGFGVPTQRALIMVALALGATYLQRALSITHFLVLALGAVVVLDPAAVLAPGFWLSFLAVAAILWVSVADDRSRWRAFLRVNWATALVLAPVLLICFRQIALISPLANCLAVPVIGMLLTPLVVLATLLSGIPTVASPLFAVAEWILESLWPLLVRVSELPFAVWHHPPPSLWAGGLALLGSAVLLLPRGMPARWTGAMLMLPMLCNRPPAPAVGTAELTLLDVGQGLAAAVRTHSRVLIFDTGGSFGEDFNFGDAAVIPYLEQIGADRIDALVVSHADNDHIGGAAAVLKRFPVGQAYSSVPGALGPTAQPCVSGQTWAWDAVQFAMLWPESADGAGSDNNRSCVLKVTTSAGAVLLTGDIERPAERVLVEYYGTDLQADVLVVPHHGSKTSTSYGFAAAVAPKLALIPAGYHNRFGFPHPSVVKRLQGLGASLFNTADSGALTVTLGAARPLTAVAYRKVAGRYWNSEADAEPLPGFRKR